MRSKHKNTKKKKKKLCT